MYRWESENERLRRFMRIPPQKKMEWLQQMHEFLLKAWTKKQRREFFKLREAG
jgi:hypothetical protein